MHVHASFILVPAAFFFLMGGAFGRFTSRPVLSIGAGIAVVIFIVWIVLELISTYDPPNLNPAMFTIALFVAAVGAFPAWIGGAIGRWAKRRMSS